MILENEVEREQISVGNRTQQAIRHTHKIWRCGINSKEIFTTVAKKKVLQVPENIQR